VEEIASSGTFLSLALVDAAEVQHAAPGAGLDQQSVTVYDTLRRRKGVKPLNGGHLSQGS
jgi:hypothetical protein